MRSFAICREPGASELQLYADTPQAEHLSEYSDSSGLSDPSVSTFSIGGWLSPWKERIILREIDDSQANRNLIADILGTMPPSDPNTAISREGYISSVNAIIENCRRRGGKTVYSRVIAGRMSYRTSEGTTDGISGMDILEAALKLFVLFPDSCGFLFFTPQTGCWIGATPEILLDFDRYSREAYTMALAGTRPATSANTPWDNKNIIENRFVCDYIADRFRAAGITPEISAPITHRFGRIEHLRHDIRGVLPADCSFETLIDSLNPTPALCGYPREEAINDINRYEIHRRLCYGGFIAISTPDRIKAYVNLRSARIIPYEGALRYEIYAGGGIVADSDPAQEWEETRIKAAPLLSLLGNREL